jgi:hypothetical protein
MHVDRARFLLLATALASPLAACPPTVEASDRAEAEATDTCDNRQGSPAQCSLKAPGPQCESFADTRKECPVVRDLLDPRVSEKFVECLNQKSGTQAICDFEAASSCMAPALAVACIESETAAVCRKLVAGCDRQGPGHELTVQNCQQALSATAHGQHRTLISSMSESCTTRYTYWDLSTAAH